MLQRVVIHIHEVNGSINVYKMSNFMGVGVGDNRLQGFLQTFPENWPATDRGTYASFAQMIIDFFVLSIPD